MARPPSRPMPKQMQNPPGMPTGKPNLAAAQGDPRTSQVLSDPQHAGQIMQTASTVVGAQPGQAHFAPGPQPGSVWVTNPQNGKQVAINVQTGQPIQGA